MRPRLHNLIFVFMALGVVLGLLLGQVEDKSSEGFTTFLDVFDLGTIIRRLIKGSFADIFVGNWNSESGSDLNQLLFIDLFLVVGDVLSFARFAHAVSLDGFGKDDRRLPLMIRSGLESCINFFWVMSSASHPFEFLV